MGAVSTGDGVGHELNPSQRMQFRLGHTGQASQNNPNAMIDRPINRQTDLHETLTKRVRERLSQALVEDFQRDGAIVVRQLLNAQELNTLTEGIEANLAHPSPRAIVASRPDDPGRFIEDFCTWQDNAAYQRLMFESPLAHVAQRLMASHTVRWYHDHLLIKEPGTRQRTPWHQDQPYYNIEGQQNVSMWIPADPVSRASTLEFVAGSHRGPWLMPRTFMDHQAKWFPEGSLAELPDIESARSQFPIIGWALEPGDLVCFHMLSLHAAAGVDGPNRRRVFSARFLGDDIRHAPRPWVTSPPFPGLDERLAPNAPMDDALFPLLIDGT
jgi:ectoine hydroxylase-related dioxygenase (phytanoyl-CoA dioxygenase family)